MPSDRGQHCAKADVCNMAVCDGTDCKRRLVLETDNVCSYCQHQESGDECFNCVDYSKFAGRKFFIVT
jgi:hypothetical protein